MFWIFLIWVVNFGISWWNAYACGKAWVETRVYGGWPRFMVWMGAIMSASGFSWCLLILIAVGVHAGWPQYFPERAMIVSLSLGYIVIIPGVLFSGFMIMIDSWARAYREGGFTNYGVAAWNTYAQIHNTYSAIEGLGDAFASVTDFWDSDDDSGGIVVFLVVIAALFGGILLTAMIIRNVAGREPLPKPPDDWCQGKNNPEDPVFRHYSGWRKKKSARY